MAYKQRKQYKGNYSEKKIHSSTNYAVDINLVKDNLSIVFLATNYVELIYPITNRH